MSNRFNWEKRNNLEKVKSFPKPNDLKNPSKVMESKFNSTCVSCKKNIEKGSKIRYYPEIKMATHINCKKPI